MEASAAERGITLRRHLELPVTTPAMAALVAKAVQAAEQKVVAFIVPVATLLLMAPITWGEGSMLAQEVSEAVVVWEET